MLEDVPRLHLPSMLAAGQAVPGDTIGTDLVHMTARGEHISFYVCVELKERRGQVLIYPPGERCYVVQVASDPQPFGGRRWWFVCPLTGRCVSALYLPPGAARFASRQAHGLSYQTQRLGAAARAREREARG